MMVASNEIIELLDGGGGSDEEKLAVIDKARRIIWKRLVLAEAQIGFEKLMRAAFRLPRPEPVDR